MSQCHICKAEVSFDPGNNFWQEMFLPLGEICVECHEVACPECIDWEQITYGKGFACQECTVVKPVCKCGEELTELRVVYKLYKNKTDYHKHIRYDYECKYCDQITERRITT